MGRWIQRIVLSLGLAILVGGLILYFWSVAMVEGALASHVDARGGALDIESIRLRSEGLAIEIDRYEEAGFTLRGLTLLCPWSQLWSLRDGLGGRLHIEEIRLTADAAPAAKAGQEPVPPASVVAELARQIDGWPLRAVELVVDDLVVEHAGQAYRLGAELSLLRGAGGDTHVTAGLEGRGVDVELRIKVSAGGGGLALDFVGSAEDWVVFQQRYLAAFAERLSQRRAEFYLNPLGEARGFLDVSGYARWTSSQAEALSFTLLADVGAGEFYFPEGECLLQGASFGLASDGAGRVRAYAKGAVESVRHGSWMQTGGDWALRVDGARLAAELRLGGSVSVSLGHDDWRRALAGAGEGRVYLEADGVDAEWLRLVPVEGVPDDLAFDMDVRLEGRGTFDNFALADAAVDADAEIRQASLASKGLTLRDLRARAGAGVSGGAFAVRSLEVQLAEANVSGFTLSEVGTAVERLDDGRFTVSPIEAGFMGGKLRVGGITVDPARLDDLSLRASVDSVELTQLAAAVPQFKGEISGTVSGHLVAEWREGQLILTDGQLEVDPETGARLRYDVAGLLTGGLSPGSAAYKQYRMAERAFADLALKRFRIEVFPAGNATRPFRMELFGESVQDGTVVPVDFDLNVNVDDTAGLLEILRLMRQGQLELN